MPQRPVRPGPAGPGTGPDPDKTVVMAVAEGGDTAEAKVREASDAIARLVRS